MNWNIFWGCYVMAFAIAMYLVWYFLYFRKRNFAEKCTCRIEGEVARYSMAQYNGFSLPVVEYWVNGELYKVVGPKFKGSVVKSLSTPFSNVETQIKQTNLNTREDLPDVLKVSMVRNSVNSITYSPLLELYPIGSTATVYYNPDKPKMAYVQRYVALNKWWLHLILAGGIIFTAIALYLFFGPTIVMH